MKKKGHKKIDGNVILFPDLEKRLLDRGLEQLQKKDYYGAIDLLERAKDLSPDDADIYTGLVLTYYEAEMLPLAKDLAQDMLKKGIGEYFQVVDLYLMILVQLHEYKEILTTIEMLQEEREIPFEKQEHFYKLLEFSRKMVEAKRDQEEGYVEEIMEEEEPIHLSVHDDPSKLLLPIAELSHKNIRPHIDEVKNYLQDPKGHPFLKTMLFHILQEQEYAQDIVIKKFGWELECKPTDVLPLQENKQMEYIKNRLEKLESKEPTLFQQVISLLERHLFLLYPFELQPAEPSVWAASYHLIGLEFNGLEPTMEKIAKDYGVERIKMEKSVNFIKKLEEISYPII